MTRFVMADEPTANLDAASTAGLLDIMQKLNESEGITFIFSTHDPRVITQRQESSSVSSLEIDYSFAGHDNWTTRAAILHISNPQKPENAPAWFHRQLNPRTPSFTHLTGYVDAGFDLSPLTRLTLTTTYYQDGSFFIRTDGTHSLSDDWQLLAVLQRFDGDNNSLFGQAPSTSTFLQMKWSY